MTVPGGPGRSRPPGVDVRVETPDDEKAIAAVVAAAFRTPDGADSPEAHLVHDLRLDHRAFLPRFSLVAVQGGVVVGHVLASRIQVGNGPALALAPLSVLPRLQRQGVASALVQRVLAEATAAGETLVVVLGDPAFYGRFRFESAADLGITGPYTGPAFQALRLAADAPVGEAVYPTVFTALGEGRL